MALKKWEDLPTNMRTDEVKPYYDILQKRRHSLWIKRAFDFFASLILLIILAIPMIIIAITIKIDSKGPAFYLQDRVTANGKVFKIHKFRTMVVNAEKIGSAVTVKNDARVTKIGKQLRRFRLDELPQLLDVLSGNMSFVGTRPEVVKYVKQYKPEFMATLLLPAGITSEASIRYKNEYAFLSEADDVDKVYIENILPAKMVWNLNSIERFSFLREMLTLLRTVFAVLGKEYK